MAKPTRADHAYAQHYGKKYGIPANVLLGLVDVETGGTFRGDLVSPAGARGRTQFMPGTARQYKVKIGDAASEYRGAAEYLRDLGYRHDAKHALASYNGGPGNPQYGYAKEVLKRAGRYKGASRGAGAALPAPAGPGGVPATIIPGEPSSGFSGAQQGSAVNVAQLLGAIKPQPAPPSASIPALPQVLDARSHLAMPQGYTAPPPSSPAAPKLDVAAALQAAAQLRGPEVPKASKPTIVAPGRTPDGKVPTLRGSVPDAVRNLFERADAVDRERLPYKWGGGHGPKPAKPGVPLDCSGAVSRILGVNPRVSGQFASFGKAGRGKHVTIYANATHVLMEINGHFWGTSGTNPGGGAGWIPRSAISSSYLQRFTARHPNGL